MHWRRKWQPTPVFLPGESQGWGSLVGCRLWGHTELDTPEQLSTQAQQDIISISISCLENPMDGGAWWAAVHGVAKSQTWLSNQAHSKLAGEYLILLSRNWIFLETRLEEERAMATHSSTLAWKIPWTEEPGRLQSTGSLRVGHGWSDFTAAAVRRW